MPVSEAELPTIAVGDSVIFGPGKARIIKRQRLRNRIVTALFLAEKEACVMRPIKN